MKNFKDFLNRVNIIYFITSYILILICLIFFKIKPYDFNLSSLIGIWKGFAELNPLLIDKDFVIYNDGGYDGQFFYLISKSLFTNGLQSFPILDSFYLRFNRLGLPALSGLITNIFGFKFYPYITLTLLALIHIYSFLLLNKLLAFKNKYLSYFYLFSPFTLNSILLLVADSLFTSFIVICIYLLNQLGASFFNSTSNTSKQNKTILSVIAFIILLFTCLIRESGLVVVGTFFLLCVQNKKFKNATPIFLAGLFYVIITLIFKYTLNVYPGTNPLGFLDLIDYPFLGFYQSIQIQSFSDIKSMLRELAKFPIFAFYILLILNVKNVKNFRDLILFLPILFILFAAGVGEVGYWLSFDNISRMFTVSLAWIILLRNQNDTYNDYYALRMSFLILILLTIRIIYIKSPMSYYNF